MAAAVALALAVGPAPGPVLMMMTVIQTTRLSGQKVQPRSLLSRLCLLLSPLYIVPHTHRLLTCRSERLRAAHGVHNDGEDNDDDGDDDDDDEAEHGAGGKLQLRGTAAKYAARGAPRPAQPQTYVVASLAPSLSSMRCPHTPVPPTPLADQHNW